MGLLARTALFSALVAALVLFEETRALENLAFGQQTLRLGISTRRWHDEPSVTDGNLTSCPRYGSTSFTLNFTQTTVFSWIRIVGQSGAGLPRVSVQTESSRCESVPEIVRERHIQDWICDSGVAASRIDFSSTTTFVCEILIYTGSAANVALRKPASQSSTFDGEDIYQKPPLTYRAAAGLAVDGAPTKNYEDKTCAVTDWLGAPGGTNDPWWQVDLGAPYDVIRVDIYSRPSAKFPGLTVTVGGQATAIVPRTSRRSFPLLGFLTPPVTASNVTISLSGFGILQLCEVEVFALKDCPGNTYGLNCERNCSATCRNDRCNAFNGTCLQGCDPGYTGANCTSDVDECQSSPCSSRGACQNTLGSFSCTCDPGYTGQLCDTEVDECDSDPCENGGTCQDRLNNYICLCRPGYTGMNCAADINECNSSPCKNGAACENSPGSFRCNCVSGYSGPLCEIDINECSSGPCQNRATCQDRVNGYECQCRLGFTGVHCETDIDECESGPCQNNATCQDAVNGYSCRCLAGFTGTHCEINIDECTSNPCRFGTCEDGINGYTCLCAPGLQGQFCDQGCGNWTFGVNCRETCGDGCLGSCDRRNGSCSGGCHVGWTGLSCREDVDECAMLLLCQNGGSCTNTPGSYTCQCTPEYTGRACSSALSDDKSLGLYLWLGLGLPLLLLLVNAIAFVVLCRRRNAPSSETLKAGAMEMEPREEVRDVGQGAAAAGISMEATGARDQGAEIDENVYERVQDYELLDDETRTKLDASRSPYAKLGSAARSHGGSASPPGVASLGPKDAASQPASSEALIAPGPHCPHFGLYQNSEAPAPLELA